MVKTWCMHRRMARTSTPTKECYYSALTRISLILCPFGGFLMWKKHQQTRAGSAESPEVTGAGVIDQDLLGLVKRHHWENLWTSPVLPQGCFEAEARTFSAGHSQRVGASTGKPFPRSRGEQRMCRLLLVCTTRSNPRAGPVSSSSGHQASLQLHSTGVILQKAARLVTSSSTWSQAKAAAVRGSTQNYLRLSSSEKLGRAQEELSLASLPYHHYKTHDLMMTQ